MNVSRLWRPAATVALAATGVTFGVLGFRLRRAGRLTILHGAPVGGGGGGGLGRGGPLTGVDFGPSVSTIPAQPVEKGDGELQIPKAYPTPGALSDPRIGDLALAPTYGKTKRVHVDLYVENQELGWTGHAGLEATFEHTGLVVEQTKGPKAGTVQSMSPVSTSAGQWVFAGFRLDGSKIALDVRAAPVPINESGYPAGPNDRDYTWVGVPWRAVYAWKVV